jgi:hypothetical protein
MITMKLVDDSVYEPLRNHLLFSGKQEVTMSFAEIERVLGRKLPPSARKQKAWWSNNRHGHVQADAWLRSSYKTSDLDLTTQRVTFVLDLRRGGGFMDAKQVLYSAAGLEPPKEIVPLPGKRIHPAFGSLQGTSIVTPGYDLTQPTYLLLGETGGD